MTACSDAPAIDLALVYLARGAAPDAVAEFQRFVLSYRLFAAGVPHTLVVVFKGFADAARLREGQAVFDGVPHQAIHAPDDAYDLGAYRVAAQQVGAERMCFVNTYSAVVAENWLAKLSANLALPGIGLVGATGSFESLWQMDPRFPAFPNVHIRSNAFMMRRVAFLQAMDGVATGNKLATHLVESGPDSLTARVQRDGQSVLVVGRDGRGYAPAHWVVSRTLRLGGQDNLLVQDNMTRSYAAAPFTEKQALAAMSWGRLLQDWPNGGDLLGWRTRWQAGA